jgi:hypothetical protein
MAALEVPARPGERVLQVPLSTIPDASASSSHSGRSRPTEKLTNSDLCGLQPFGAGSAVTRQAEGIAMNNTVAAPEQPAMPPRPPRRASAGAILTLVNGILAGVASVFVGTHSVLITVIAAAVAVALAAMLLITQR